MLDDDRTIRNQRPKLIRLQARIALQMVQKCLLVRVVVGVALLYPQELLPRSVPPTATTATPSLISVFARRIGCIAVADEVCGRGSHGIATA